MPQRLLRRFGRVILHRLRRGQVHWKHGAVVVLQLPERPVLGGDRDGVLELRGRKLSAQRRADVVLHVRGGHILGVGRDLVFELRLGQGLLLGRLRLRQLRRGHLLRGVGGGGVHQLRRGQLPERDGADELHGL